MPPIEVVITGVGLVSPLGIGRELVWDAFCAGRSGVAALDWLKAEGMPIYLGAEVNDFDPRAYVKQRKSLKVMARDAQLGVAASDLAVRDARIGDGMVDPDRFGVVLGGDRICGTIEDSEMPYRQCMIERKFEFGRWGPDAIPAAFPLGFLKLLPNMIASHISIAHDARGPSNTIHHAEVSSLLAVIEAVRVIQRGAADVMIAGGASSQMTPLDWMKRCVTRYLSRRHDDPAAAMRPFDADRDGEVYGEGAGMFVLESREHAETRGACILARVLGCASAGEPGNGALWEGAALQRAIRWSLAEARLTPKQLGHVNAQGFGTLQEDPIEARALCATVGGVPVFAPRSYFGNLGAAGGAIEMAASVLSFGDGCVPATLNYARPDPDCPLTILCDKTGYAARRTALTINWTRVGQAVAVILAGAE